MHRLDTAAASLCCALLSAAAGAGPLPDLLAASPDPARAAELTLFAPLLGHWEYSYRFHDVSGRVTEQGTGTWDFSWVLQGRSIQDVQTFHSADGRLSEFGTTLRIPLGQGLWKAVWDGPLRRNVCVLTARADAGGILMDGQCNTDPEPERWMFRDISATGFEWRGYFSPDQGKHWVLEEEISAKRAAN
jgi:hypothetical protein